MSILNLVLKTVVDLLQIPFRGLAPLVGVLFWSVVTGIAMLLVFKKTSNQEALAEVKRRIHGCLFEIRLFNDDLRAILRAQGEILRHNLTYLRLSVVPMLWVLPPLILLMVQLHAFYGFRALHPGEKALVTAELGDGWQEMPADAGSRPAISLELPEGLALETPGVWVPSLAQMTWRIAAVSNGDFTVELVWGEERTTKEIPVSDRLIRISPTRPDHSFLAQLEWPSEPPLPKGLPIRAVNVTFPEGEISLGGWYMEWEWAWMLAFFILSMVVAFVLKGKLGVTI